MEDGETLCETLYATLCAPAIKRVEHSGSPSKSMEEIKEIEFDESTYCWGKSGEGFISSKKGYLIIFLFMIFARFLLDRKFVSEAFAKRMATAGLKPHHRIDWGFS